MGTKYIVELEDGEHLYKTTINALGNPVMRSAEKVPYTESDLEQVRREAYDKGYDDAVEEIGSDEQAIADKAYKKGLSDAWEAARKLVMGDINIITSVFDTASRSAPIRDLTAAEAVEKLRACGS